MRAPAGSLGRLDGLDLLRGVACVAVVFGHLMAWFAIERQDWWLSQAADTALGRPLHLNPQLAFIGVGSFFLITGVVITASAFREKPGQFLFRRVSRLVPLLWAVTVLAWIMINLGQRITPRLDQRLDVVDLLIGMVLGNFFQVPQVAFVGVTWTLVIQIVFYVWVTVTIPVLRRRPWIAPALAAAVCFVGILGSVAARGNPSVDVRVWAHHAGIWAAYIPLLVIGQIVALAYLGRIHRYTAVALGAVHFLLWVWVDRISGFTFQGDALPRTVMIMLLVLLVLMRVRGPVSSSRFVRAFAARTYAIYLVHVGCLYPVMDALVPRIGVELAVLTGLITVGVVAEILHRFVEMPADRWLRARRRKRPAEPAAAERAKEPTPA
ncbi:acyltransferase family protein [Actinokineospora fastidiosa]|uniref:Acyltransferase n=1 Tax=Actinokineospora fastidiosa TaxID=1816 RepID=A0A918L7S5_9PSEU|nr:acyltransferase [Actinokineospora fastidiosa]GGS18586.1 acyltransferase [Actinokineospora fastidiosa]